MKAYFLHDGNQKSGPFTIEELKQKGVEATTLIWFDGLGTWTKAGEIPELQEILLKSPPPLTKQSAVQTAIDKTKEVLDKDIVDEIENKIPTKKGKRVFTWSITLLAVIGLVFLINSVFKPSIFNSKKGKAIDSLIVISPDGEVGPDYLDNSKTKIVIHGSIQNIASTWAYKDLKIEVEYYNLDDKLVETKQHIINRTINPLEKEDLHNLIIKGEIPAGGTNYNLKWKLLDATQVLPE